MFWWNRKSLMRVLSNCVLCREGSFVTFPELGTFYPARFAALGEMQLELEVMPTMDADVHTASFCCVSFKHDFKPHLFVSTLLDYRDERAPRLPTLVMELPDRLLVEKRRIASRVPVLGNAGLIVRATLGNGRVWAPTAVNLSLGGVLLTFPAEDPEISVGTTFDLALMLDSHAVSLMAEVRRRDDTGYGVEFSSVFDETGLNPPSALRDIVRTIERKWFNRQFRQSAKYFHGPEDNANCTSASSLVARTIV